MKPLNILHTEASPGLGGQEKRILLEAAFLRKRGHRVLVVGQPESLIGREAGQSGVPYRSVRMRTSWDPVAFARLLSLVREIRPDVIHTHSSKDSWLAGLVGRLLGVPVVRTRHVSIPVSGHPFNWAYRLPSRIMTTADLTRRMLAEAGLCEFSKVSVLPTGVDISRFNGEVSGASFRAEFGVPDGIPVVGLVANLRKSKGVEHFLAAARLVKEEGNATRFFVVGEGHWGEIFQEQAKQLGLADGTVTFTGYREDIPEVMAALDLLVIASTRTEGIPQVALQAMAMGVAIVGTDIGGIPEAILPAGAGIVVPPGDPDAMAGAVRELIREPGRFEQMGASGRSFVGEHHTIEKMLDETEQIYKEVVSECAN
ncbi:MAG: glycosyltransferase family 4 protein [Nitrospinota bacterium]|nr:glycosyltransferase family 4 protein [Nitrospinota bacterium]